MAIDSTADARAILQSGLTVGEAAAVISGILNTVHFLIPTVLVALLIGIIRSSDRAYNAATWDLAAATIYKSYWAEALSKTAGNLFAPRLVSWRVYIISLAIGVCAVANIVAGFVTTRPLVDKVEVASSLSSADFVSAVDYGFFGQASMDRPQTPVTRVCRSFINSTNYFPRDCPDSVWNNTLQRNQHGDHTVVNSTIPLRTLEPFMAATSGSTIAGPADIHFRSWYSRQWSFVDNGQSRPNGFLVPLSTIVLDGGYRLVEGLIVDAINGGIGFRNHSMPTNLALGAEWTEDILWVEPHTSCTGTNLSLHYSVSAMKWYAETYGYLQDDGGFSRLSPDTPEPSWDDTVARHYNDVGLEPDLPQRSYITAWWNNQFVAQAIGLDSAAAEVGTKYPGTIDRFTTGLTTGTITIGRMDGLFLDNINDDPASTTANNFQYFGRRCAGFDDDNPSNASKVYIRCGYLYALPHPSNLASGQSWRPDLNSNWTQELYVCASATKASVKTVTFSTNTSSSSDLRDLRVVSVADKDWSGSQLPLWGIENTPGYEIRDIDPLWGLVGDSYEHHPNLTTRRAQAIYLPMSRQDGDFGDVVDLNSPGQALNLVWNSVYGAAAVLGELALGYVPNYSGLNDYAMTLKWRELSQNQTGAEQLLNLIWTDIAAFALKGANSGFEKDPAGAGENNVLGKRSVYRHIHYIGYNDWRQALPALFLVFVLVLGMLVYFVLQCLPTPFGIKTIGHYVQQISMPRAITQEKWPDLASASQGHKEWSKAVGHKPLEVPPRQPSSRQRSHTGSHGRALSSDQAHLLNDLAAHMSTPPARRQENFPNAFFGSGATTQTSLHGVQGDSRRYTGDYDLAWARSEGQSSDHVPGQFQPLENTPNSSRRTLQSSWDEV